MTLRQPFISVLYTIARVLGWRQTEVLLCAIVQLLVGAVFVSETCTSENNEKYILNVTCNNPVVGRSIGTQWVKVIAHCHKTWAGIFSLSVSL